MNSDAPTRPRPASPSASANAGPYDAGASSYPRPGETPFDAAAGDPGPAESPATSAARAIPGYIAELSAYATYWLAAKLDAIKLGVRNVAVYAALGVVGVIAAGAVVVTAVVLLLAGLARLLDTVTHTVWAGDLIVGVVVLAGLALGIYAGVNKFMGVSRKKTEQKYESKRIDQRDRYGRDVKERATEP
jgi:hypothetical protein